MGPSLPQDARASALLRDGRIVTLLFAAIQLFLAGCALKLFILVVWFADFLYTYRMFLSYEEMHDRLPKSFDILADTYFQMGQLFRKEFPPSSRVVISSVVVLIALYILIFVWRNRPRIIGPLTRTQIDLDDPALPAAARNLVPVRSNVTTIRGDRLYLGREAERLGRRRDLRGLFNFVVHHEFFHLRSLDASVTLVLRVLSNIASAPLLVMFFVIAFAVSNFGFDSVGVTGVSGLLLSVLCGVFVVSFVWRVCRLDVQSFVFLKEWFADTYAHCAAGVHPYRDGGVVRSTIWQERPPPQQRSAFLRNGTKCERTPLLLATLIFKWFCLRILLFYAVDDYKTMFVIELLFVALTGLLFWKLGTAWPRGTLARNVRTATYLLLFSSAIVMPVTLAIGILAWASLVGRPVLATFWLMYPLGTLILAMLIVVRVPWRAPARQKAGSSGICSLLNRLSLDTCNVVSALALALGVFACVSGWSSLNFLYQARAFWQVIVYNAVVGLFSGLLAICAAKNLFKPSIATVCAETVLFTLLLGTYVHSTISWINVNKFLNVDSIHERVMQGDLRLEAIFFYNFFEMPEPILRASLMSLAVVFVVLSVFGMIRYRHIQQRRA